MDKIDVLTRLYSETGHVANMDEVVSFSFVVNNSNDYKRDLTDLKLVCSFDQEFFSFLDGTLKQDGNVIDKNEDGSYTLEDIVANGESVITFSMKVIKLSNIESNMQVTLDYSYLNRDDVLVNKSISQEHYMYLVDSINRNVLIESSYTNITNVGGDIDYSISLTNTSGGIIDYVFVKNVFDDLVQFVDGSVTIDGVESATDDITVGVSPGFMDIDAVKVIGFKARALNRGVTACKTTVIISNDGEEISRGGESSTFSTRIKASINEELEVLKSSEKSSYVVNTNASFFVKIKNTGNVDFYDLMLNDVLDDNLEFVSDSLRLDGYLIDGDSVLDVAVGKLKIGEEKVVSFSTKCLNVGDDISNMASVGGKYYDNDNAPVEVNVDSDSIGIDVISVAKGEVLFTKEVDKNVCNLNDTVNFILKFKNTGNVDLEHVHVADNFDDMFTYNENSTKIDGIVTGNIIDGVDFLTLKVGEEHRIDFSATANTVYDRIPNSAVMAAYYDEVVLNPITNEVYVTVLGEVQASGTLSVNTDKDTYQVGEEVLFTITLSNTGNIVFDSVLLTDILDDKLEFVTDSLIIDNMRVLYENINEGITLNNILDSSNHIITFKALGKNIGSVSNSASAVIKYNDSGEVKELNLDSNIVSFDLVQPSIGEATVTKSIISDKLHVGDVTTITIRVKNFGNTLLSDVVLIDKIPSGLNYLSDTLTIDGVKSSGNINEGVSLPDIGVDGEIVVRFDVSANTISEVVNSASLIYSYFRVNNKKENKQIESNPLTILITNTKKGEMEIVKSSNKLAYELNEVAKFSFIVINKGNTDITNVFVKDELPDNYEFVDGSIVVDGESVAGNIVDGINIGTILRNNFLIVDFSATAKLVGDIVYDTIVGSYEYADDLGYIIRKNVTSNRVVTSIYNGVFPLDFVCDIYREILILDDENIFKLKISNNSDKEIQDVTVSDILDSSYEFVSGSVVVNGVTNEGDITEEINIGSINSMDSVIVTFKARGIRVASDIENAGSVSFKYLNEGLTVSETRVSNIVVSSIIEDVDSIIIIERSVLKDTDYLGEENIVTLNLQNIGDTNGKNIFVSDMLGDAYEFVSGSLRIDNIPSDEDITKGIVIDEILADNNKLIEFNVRSIVEENNIRGISSASYTFNNVINELISENIYSNEVITSIISKKYASMVVTISASNDTILLNEVNTFTISIKNIGNVLASNIRGWNVVKDNYEFIDETSVSAIISKDIYIDKIMPGEEKIITYTARGIIEGINVENKVNLIYNYVDALGNNRLDFASSNVNLTNIVVSGEAILNVLLSQAKSEVIKDSINTFSVIITNKGNRDANNILVKSILPNNYEFISSSLKFNDQHITGDIIKGVSIGDIAAGETRVISFEAQAIVSGKDISVSANAIYDYIDNVGGKVSKSIGSNILLSNINLYQTADLYLEKLVYPTTYMVGDVAKYKLIVRNNGNCPASNIVIKDVLPVSLQFVNGSIYVDDTNMNEFTNLNIPIGSINDGDMKVVEFSVVCLMSGEDILNSALCTYMYEISPGKYVVRTSESNDCMIDVRDYDHENLIVNLSIDESTSSLWDNVRFTYTLINNGNKKLNNVVLSNYVNDYYSFVDSSIETNNRGMNNLPDIVVGDIDINESKVVNIDAVSKMVGANILNFATVGYEYESGESVIYGGINSDELITNVTDDDTATLSIDVRLPDVVLVDSTVDVAVNVNNEGMGPSTGTIFKSIFDRGISVVPDSLYIDDVKSEGDIMIGVNIGDIAPGSSVNIKYKIIPEAISDDASISSLVNYSYLDSFDVTRNISSGVSSSVRVILEDSPDILFVKDSNQTEYLIDDEVIFRVIINNNSDIDINDVLVKDFLPLEYDFVLNSVSINGVESNYDITKGFTIDLIKRRSSTVILFKVIPNSSKSIIDNVANIDYSFVNLNGDIITERMDSNTFTTGVFEDVLKSVSVLKEQRVDELKKGEVNSYSITISNDGDVDISNLEVIDLIDGHYSYIDGSLKINGRKIDYNPSYILLEELGVDGKHVIDFDVLASNSGSNIRNSASIKYNYINGIRDISSLDDISNEVISNIISIVPKEIIDLIDGIALTESGISGIIDSEVMELENVLINSTDKRMILLINASISNMLLSLIDKETYSLEMLLTLLKGI